MQRLTPTDVTENVKMPAACILPEIAGMPIHPLTGGQAPSPRHFRSSGAGRQDRAQPALPLRQRPETHTLPYANSLISKAKWVRLSKFAGTSKHCAQCTIVHRQNHGTGGRGDAVW
jgi:hypothetical protein